jgi:hypothetical protein
MNEYSVVMVFVSSILTLQQILNKINSKIMNKVNTITIKIDEDNDIYEMKVNNEVYTLDNVYESEYSELFDELNMSIELL